MAEDDLAVWLYGGAVATIEQQRGRMRLTYSEAALERYPLLSGKTPDDWRKSMYYRYYHYPGDHQVQQHYGVRTEDYKLIFFHRLNQWELFDLMNDPQELNNLYGQPGHEAITAMLKAELMRLKREVHDEDQLANEQLPDGVDGTVAILRSHPR